MCLCNKGCGFNTSHITGLHVKWAACVQNDQPFTLPDTHVFQHKMVAASDTVTQVASNNGGGTQYLPPINGGTSHAPLGGLHYMDTAVLASQYAVQTKYVCEHQKNAVSDPELSSLIDELQKAWNLN